MAKRFQVSRDDRRQTMWLPVLLTSSLLTFSHGYVLNPYNQPIPGSYGYGSQNGYAPNANSWQGSQSRDGGQYNYGLTQYRPEGSGVPRDSTNGNYQSQQATYVSGRNGLAYQNMGSYGPRGGDTTIQGSNDNTARHYAPDPDISGGGYGPVQTGSGQYNEQGQDVGQYNREVNAKRPEMFSQPEPRMPAPVDPDSADYPETGQAENATVLSPRKQPSVRTAKQSKINDLIHFILILNKLKLLD